MRSKNQKNRKKTELDNFAGYWVTAKGFGRLSIFASSENAAEQVARRILGGGAQAYEGPLKVQEEKTAFPRRRQ